MKIAFLFLTIAGIFHEEYWLDFFQGHTNRYSIYIHSKKDVPAKSAFKKYELPMKIPTSWGHTLKAQLLLLETALKDPENYIFIFISESTLPLQSFQHIYNTLCTTRKSYFFYSKNPHQDPGDICYARRNLHALPAEHRYKSTQWVIIAKPHAEKMVQDQHYSAIVSGYEADNELYPASFLSSQGLLHEVVARDYTYVNWGSIASASRRTPVIFNNIAHDDQFSCILNAIQDGYFFARKFGEHAYLERLDRYLAYRSPHVTKCISSEHRPA